MTPEPCPIHALGKLLQPDTVEHTYFAVRIYQRPNTKWFSTVARDAIQIYSGEDLAIRQEACDAAIKHIK